MKTLKISIVLIFVFQSLLTTAQGIKFEENLTWPQIKAKAKAENKYIFMDCYATWCGPCKWMSKNIFTLKEVTDFFNASFISVAVQMDQTPKDSLRIKAWYADAKIISNTYGVDAYPTYIFFSPDGKAVHRLVGTSETGSEFVENAKDAFDIRKQYYTLIDHWKEHKDDSTYLQHAINVALKASDKATASLIGDAYFECLKNPFTEDNLKLFYSIISSSKDRAFYFFLNNASKIDKIVNDEGFVERKLGRDIITIEEIEPLFTGQSTTPLVWKNILEKIKGKYPQLNDKVVVWLYSQFSNAIVYKEITTPLYRTDNATTPDWGKLAIKIKLKYPGFDPDQSIKLEIPKYYYYKKQWNKCAQTTIEYLNKFKTRYISPTQVNNMVWYNVFLNSNNKQFLIHALNWSKWTVDQNPIDEQFMDSYANLLYKTGNRREAIIYEKKAINILESKPFANQAILSDFKMNLNKMLNSQKTWIDNTPVI